MPDKKYSILKGPMFPSLMSFALPILCSLFLQALYGAVDLWMVSRFGSPADVAAVSTGSQTMMMVNGVVTGLSVGLTVMLAQAMGGRDHEKSARIIGGSAWLFGAIGLIIALFLLSCAAPLAVLLNAPGDALGKTAAYIRICGTGSVFIVGFNVLNAIFCGLGDSKTPLFFVGVACIVNIIGDYLLIDILKLGAAGAAVATVLAQGVSLLLSFCLINRILPFKLKREDFYFRPRPVWGIIKLGAPIALQNTCNEFSFLVIITLVNRLGVTAAAGVGIAEKLVMFILLIPSSFMSAISAFTAQNIGAGQPERALSCLRTGLCSAVLIGGIMAWLSFFQGKLMARIFIDDLPVIAAAAEFLKATSMECFLLSLADCLTGFFNGLGRTGYVMLQGLGAVLLVRIPYAVFAASRPEPSLFNIGLAAALAALFMLLCGCSYYFFRVRKEFRSYVSEAE